MKPEPAFPIVAAAMDVIEDSGMTLRDYFAGQALAGICTRNLLAFDCGEIAKLAYDVADAMLAQHR